MYSQSTDKLDIDICLRNTVSWHNLKYMIPKIDFEYMAIEKLLFQTNIVQTGTYVLTFSLQPVLLIHKCIFRMINVKIKNINADCICKKKYRYHVRFISKNDTSNYNMYINIRPNEKMILSLTPPPTPQKNSESFHRYSKCTSMRVDL